MSRKKRKNPGLRKIKACTEKKKFATKSEALGMLKRRCALKKYNIYKCRYCSGFHLTSKLRFKLKRMKVYEPPQYDEEDAQASY